jgi:hypothetical protein
MKVPFILALAVLGFGIGQSADAQNTETAARIIRKNFDDCVYAAAADQFKDPKQRNASLVAEQSFAACKTEEEAILTYLLLHDVSPIQARAKIIEVKLQLKKALRDKLANPLKY